VTEDAFFMLHRDLPREGPGTPQDVLWALTEAGVPDRARIADLACGPGADTVTLAEARPRATIHALDKRPHFVAAARDRTQHFGHRVQVDVGDMTAVAADMGPFDLIWCAGAVYFVGIQAALTAWRGLLAPGGAIAFSGPVWTSDPPTVAARAFWHDEPDVKNTAQITAQVRKAGFETKATRIIRGAGWEAYYTPQETRIAQLRAASPSPELSAVLDAAAREIALWRAAPDEVAYLLSIVVPR
jgi:SAM-dependent methyltransferase